MAWKKQIMQRSHTAVDPTRDWMLSNTNTVPQAPAHQSALGWVVVRSALRQVADIESPNLRDSRITLGSTEIQILGTSTRHQQSVVGLSGQQQRA